MSLSASSSNWLGGSLFLWGWEPRRVLSTLRLLFQPPYYFMQSVNLDLYLTTKAPVPGRRRRAWI